MTYSDPKVTPPLLSINLTWLLSGLCWAFPSPVLHKIYLLDRLTDVMERLKTRVEDNLENENTRKAVKYFINHMNKGLNSGNIQSLNKTLFSIGQVIVPKGMKRKNSSVISVQKTSLSRRTFRQPGSTPSMGGRKVKDHAQRALYVVDEKTDDFIKYYSLPNQKKQKRQKHSLKTSVLENKSNPKKH